MMENKEKDQSIKSTLPGSIDEVIDTLQSIIDESVRSGNYVCLFAHVYRETTIEIKKGIESGLFEDPVRMEQMDVLFANLYIRAYLDFGRGDPTPGAWDYALASGSDRLSLIQHILLGMNAHINMDLSIAAAQVANGPAIIELKNDFFLVNKILSDLTNPLQQGLGRASFLMKLLDVFGFRTDEKVINFSIKKAREFAWLNAMELALLKGKNYDRRMTEIDDSVLKLSRKIKHPRGRLLRYTLKLIQLFESADPAKIISKLTSTAKK